MRKEIDCEGFASRLEAWVDDDLEPEVRDAMRLHAGSCPDCAMKLAVHRHVTEPSQAELAAAVPDEWVESMWRDVSAELAQDRGESRGRRARWRSSWLVPSMAAAILALVMGSGFLLGEVLRLRDREAALEGALAEHEARLDDLEAGRGLPGIARRRGAFDLGSWERQLARRGSLTVGELEEALAGLPQSVTLLSRSQFDAFRANALLRGLGWRELLGVIDADDGVQAGELLGLIRELNLDPATVITPDRVRMMSRGLEHPGRS